MIASSKGIREMSKDEQKAHAVLQKEATARREAFDQSLEDKAKRKADLIKKMATATGLTADDIQFLIGGE